MTKRRKIYEDKRRAIRNRKLKSFAEFLLDPKNQTEERRLFYLGKEDNWWMKLKSVIGLFK